MLLQLQKAVHTLEAVKVSALRDIGLQRVGFSERQKLGSGKYFTPCHDQDRFVPWSSSGPNTNSAFSKTQDCLGHRRGM